MKIRKFLIVISLDAWQQKSVFSELLCLKMCFTSANQHTVYQKVLLKQNIMKKTVILDYFGGIFDARLIFNPVFL
jgi:hypothetical protein